MNLQKYNAAETAIAPAASWSQVRYWIATASKAQQLSLAAQVMAGFTLAELRKIHGTNQGKRNDLESGTSPNDSEKLDWPELVHKNCGISDDTARNWMNMAEGIKSRWKKLAPQERLRELMRVPVSDWTDKDNKLVSDALYKVTDGQTQLDFMRELGLAKKKEGNDHPISGPHKKLTTAEEAALKIELALEDSSMMGKWVNASNKSFVLTARDTDLEINAQISLLEFALKIRRKYLAAPRAQRNDALIKELQEMVRKDVSNVF